MAEVTEINPQTSNQVASIGDSSVKKFSFPGKKKNKHVMIFLGILVACIVVGVILVVFVLKKNPVDLMKPLSSGGTDTIILTETVINPLTGDVYEAGEEAAWVEDRPLAVMINNYIDARPQAGLIDADLVYEVVAEGGITRFLTFFLTNSPTKVGPIRSTREYYLVLVKELGDAMLMHIGWSPQALVAIETWPVRSLGRGNAPFWRDNPRNVAIEHTAYSDAVELRATGDALGWEGTRAFDVWEFKDDKGGYETAKLATSLSIDFWLRGDYSAVWKYDADNNTYLRYTGYDTDGNPLPHIDETTNRQMAFKNVIVQFATESNIIGDEKNRLEYELEGSGSGLVFIDGKVIEVTWSKTGRDDRTMFYDLNGNQMKFNRGKFWISIVPDRNVDQVVYD